jgi:hypothetical protein
MNINDFVLANSIFLSLVLLLLAFVFVSFKFWLKKWLENQYVWLGIGIVWFLAMVFGRFL